MIEKQIEFKKAGSTVLMSLLRDELFCFCVVLNVKSAVADLSKQLFRYTSKTISLFL